MNPSAKRHTLSAQITLRTVCAFLVLLSTLISAMLYLTVKRTDRSTRASLEMTAQANVYLVSRYFDRLLAQSRRLALSQA